MANLQQQQQSPMFQSHHRDCTAQHQSLPDSAFDPQSGFMFDDSNDDELRNMQQNIASLNVLAEQNGQHFPGMHGVNGPNMHAQGTAMGDQYGANFVDPFVFDQDVSPDSSSWPASMNMHPQSKQGDIASRRSTSVAHQHGQITPPDDNTPKGFALPSKPLRVVPPSSAAAVAKSERARNAANQRHAKAKKARKDSGRAVESPKDEEEDGFEDKRERYREKNRLAAAKCRQKKKINTEDLEESARMATAENNKLRAEERELRDLFSNLRNQALAHDPSKGCNCKAIHNYNMLKAAETARGAMSGVHMRAIASPSMRSLDSASPVSMGGTSSRTHSFSGPQHPKHSRAQSLAGMGGSRHSVGDHNQSAFRQPPIAQSTQSGPGASQVGDQFSQFMRRSSDSHQLGFQR
ncbi:Transcription factor atf21 [Fulvia fulva]|uniref:Transcription factor atf21 n=1 Tax=Passalora fulva TaxID=5499 RepID=A0A9Q8P5M4_PASFU|nr:Transcription factor atf21 [Fulvia fulva]UJO14280.1 Transcription factor atf21 [Fulvia fulva]